MLHIHIVFLIVITLNVDTKMSKKGIFGDDSDRNLLSGFDWDLWVVYSTILQTTRNLNARGHFNGLVTMQQLHTESWRPTLKASKDLRHD